MQPLQGIAKPNEEFGRETGLIRLTSGTVTESRFSRFVNFFSVQHVLAADASFRPDFGTEANEGNEEFGRETGLIRLTSGTVTESRFSRFVNFVSFCSTRIGSGRMVRV